MSEAVKNAMCGLCAEHCKIGVRVRDGEFVGVEPVAIDDSPASKRAAAQIRGCVKSHAAKEFFYHPKRLSHPLKRMVERGQNRWKQIGWDQALDEIAGKLKEITEEYGPEALLVASNGEISSSDEFRARFQSLFGTPNYMSPLHVCDGPAQTLSLILSGTNIRLSPLMPETRCLMILANNPAQSFLWFWRDILPALKNGLKLIVIDSRRTETAKKADIWLQPRPGTDTALLLAMLNIRPSLGQVWGRP